MSLGRPRHTQPPIRLRRRRIELRTVVAGVLLLGLLTASTVVSADALQQLPDIWQTIKARPGAEPAPPDLDALPVEQVPPHLPAPRIDAEPTLSIGTGSDALPRRLVLEPAEESDNRVPSPERADQSGAVPRTHQLVVGPDGRFDGRIVTLPADVAGPDPLGNTRIFVTHQGQLAATTLTDDEGRFTVSGLNTGTHALIVTGQDALFACGFHILQIDEPTAVEDPIEFTLDSAAITGDDVAAALRRVPTRPADATAPVVAADDAPAIRQTGRPATPLKTHPVRRQADGSLTGRVVQLHPRTGRLLIPPSTEIVFLQAGEVVATGLTDERGRFTIHDVEPGTYALVAATIDVDERIAEVDPSTDDDATQPVSIQPDAAGRPGFATFAVEVVSSIARVDAVANDLQPPPASLEFALMDAADLWSFTGLYSSASQRLSQGTAARSTLPPSGTKTATSSVRPAAQRPPVVNNTPPAGGGGGASFAFPVFSPDDNQQAMSPRSI